MTGSAIIHRLLRDQIERLWGQGEVDLVDANYAHDVVDHMPVPGQPGGLAGLKDVVRAFRAGLPDMRLRLHATLAAGDMGVDVWTLNGTHTGTLFGRPATERSVSFSGIDMVQVRDGRITALWHVEEMLHFEQQLGIVQESFGTPLKAVPVAATDDSAYEPGADAYVPGLSDFNAQEHRNLAIARTHIEELWAKGRHDLAWQLYAPDVVDHNPAPGQRPGIAGIVDVLGWLREAVPDLRMRIGCYVIDGNMVADRWTMTGTHNGAPLMGITPRGRRFTIAGMDVCRIGADGLITDVWHCEEFLKLRTQIA